MRCECGERMNGRCEEEGRIDPYGVPGTPRNSRNSRNSPELPSPELPPELRTERRAMNPEAEAGS